MRLLLTTDTVGGVWTYALELSRALSARGVELHLATMGAPLSRDQRAEAECVPRLAIHESRYRLEWMNEPWDDVRQAGEWLLRIEQDVRPDVVHLNGYAHGALPWSAPTLVVGHSCVLSWWQAARGEAAPPEWARYRREVAAGLHAADMVAAPTRAMLAELGRHYRLPAGRSRVLVNGREPSLFPPGEKEPFILTAGRLWDIAKNVAALETVAAGLEWPVYVAGEDQHPEGGKIRHLHSHPLGRLEPDVLRQWFSRASIYALPARYEPFGLSALEAALAGCALVLGDLPSLREVWGDAALFVPPDDTDALAAALRALIRDPGAREEFAARARARALRYTPERMASGYIEAYRLLLEGGGVQVEVEEEEVSCVS